MHSSQMRPGARGARSWPRSGDTLDMRGRMTSSHFVGRAGELAELELASREADAGRPAVVLLGGESGVGKTRLVGELEQRLTSTLVLRGESVEQSDHGDGELPYAPLLSALRPLIRERNEVFDQLSGASRTQLAALIPGLGEGGTRSVGRGDAPGQLRMFEALLDLLDLLSSTERSCSCWRTCTGRIVRRGCSRHS